MITSVIDPGGVNCCYTVFNKNKPIYSSYLDMGMFEMKPESMVKFQKYVKPFLKICDKIIMERFSARIFLKNISTERLHGAMYTIMFETIRAKKELVLTTPQSWKPKVKYDKCWQYARLIGYKTKDKHCVDTILMFCFHNEICPINVLKGGLKCLYN